ncbi:hypothetical protein, partial [Enterobacter sp.]|uniref:hypothetical protein n=1 Tax=Enterobacter sp. TaxID=42895 RepID=UPI0028FE09AF
MVNSDTGTLARYSSVKSDDGRVSISSSRNPQFFGLAPIFPYTFYHLTHDWFVAADIPVANDTPVH